jgi:hypothetical protein
VALGLQVSGFSCVLVWKTWLISKRFASF